MNMSRLSKTIPDLIFLVGLGALSYGFWLAWRPLGFIVGGIVLAAAGGLLGRDAQRRAESKATRRQS
jgi:hypothetical protein